MHQILSQLLQNLSLAFSSIDGGTLATVLVGLLPFVWKLFENQKKDKQNELVVEIGTVHLTSGQVERFCLQGTNPSPNDMTVTQIKVNNSCYPCRKILRPHEPNELCTIRTLEILKKIEITILGTSKFKLSKAKLSALNNELESRGIL